MSLGGYTDGDNFSRKNDIHLKSSVVIRKTQARPPQLQS